MGIVIIICVTLIILFHIYNEHRCKHEWEVQNVIDVYDDYHRRPIRKKYVLQCKKCGKIKKKNI